MTTFHQMQFEGLVSREEHEAVDDPTVPKSRYRGPHGPCDMTSFDHGRQLRVWGPNVPEGTVRFDQGDPLDGVHRTDQLRRGITGTIGDHRLRMQLSGRPGLTRRSRALQVQVEDRSYRLRVRGLMKKLVLERADGTSVATFAVRWATGEKVSADASPDEVVLTILLTLLNLEDDLAPRV